MAKVLVGWELGMGLWHVAALRDVARELRARGHEVVMALADPVETWPLLDGEGFVVLQAPRSPPRPMLIDEVATGAETFADILVHTGFGSFGELMALTSAWQGLIDLVRPDLVVCDHSPVLRLAAYQALPVVELGLAFTMPPHDIDRFPPMYAARPRSDAEAKVAAVIAQVQARRARPCPPTVPALFAAAGRFIVSFPEFDPYAAFTPRPYAGTLGGWLAPTPLPAAPRFFAYLAADVDQIGTLLEGLVRSGVPGAFYLRGAPAAMRRDLARRGVTVYDTPANIGDELARTSVVVHHGGAGLSQQAASAGRPQLIVPRHLEQSWNATALEVLGVGLTLPVDAKAPDVASALRRLAREPAHAAAAQAWAAVIASRGHGVRSGRSSIAASRL